MFKPLKIKDLVDAFDLEYWDIAFAKATDKGHLYYHRVVCKELPKTRPANVEVMVRCACWEKCDALIEDWYAEASILRWLPKEELTLEEA